MNLGKAAASALYIEMKKTRKDGSTSASFGERLRQIRESRGFSQEQLGREIGVSQRMIAYYENHAPKAPAHHLMKIADVLRVTLDELIGYKPFNAHTGKRNSRLWHKLRQVETMPPKDRKQILQLIDTITERERLKAAR